MNPRLAVLLAAALFATGGAAVKATDFSAWQVASLRSGIAAVALAALFPRALGRVGWRSVLVGTAYAATMILYVVANKLTTAAGAIFLQSTAPLYVLALAPWLLGEKIRKADLFWMLGIAAGLAALLADGDAGRSVTAPDPSAGNLLAAGAGFTWALAILGLRWLGRASDADAGRRAGRAGEGAMGSVVVGNALAALVALPFALPLVVDIADATAPAAASDWGVIAYLGLFQIGLAYVLLTSGISQVPAFDASLLLLAEPVLSPFWAWAVHGELPGPWTVVGGALVLAATVGRSWTRERRPTP
jgi:drug/metabolite transporter (DMT)-like permease